LDFKKSITTLSKQLWLSHERRFESKNFKPLHFCHMTFPIKEVKPMF